jgi:hypothetical protein
MTGLHTYRLRTFVWVLLILWTSVVFGLFLLDSQQLSRTVKDLATAEATA